MNDRRPSFTEVVDWLDGRLEDWRAQHVAGWVAADAELRADADWIREFHRVSALMPLQAPPPETSRRLHGLLDQLRPATGHRPTLDLEFDSRTAPLAVGMRSAGVTAQRTFDLTFGGPDLSVSLHATPAGTQEVSISGVVCAPGADTAGLGLVFRAGDEVRRVASCDATGRFSTVVDVEVDELQISGAGLNARVALDLTPR